ncbi:nickel pincer cofactor biosynthesis protein LarB [Lentilactobacillus parafarraginis]|jgi:NCAIR mutase (PurE)-related protein|uniref:Nickel pincer cofactor biosynthesis protein LarB n=1 Tax=Lentilactobacillus parafarraginis TaxID=390842 RepID=A0A5R9CYD0_9LACO|nr:nickel pincer cofactor biosynthesis protein LarB [Lentilactobacillus parafarraginis]TLQ20782.1 nickel pincer cofactor biosynthesis protein LarB [Lentilactobacillus parafarraginis]
MSKGSVAVASEIKDILNKLARNQIDVDQAAELLSQKTVSDLDFSKVDLERQKRTGYPEVIYGEGKTVDQIVAIMSALHTNHQNILATRISPEQAAGIQKALPNVTYHETARCMTEVATRQPETKSFIAVVTAGTTDIPVAEEAAVTAELYGNRVQKVYDVGVAGLQRLLMHIDTIRQAKVVIVVAGMEGALVSVVGGLVDVPVIAVPTSVGYGASFKGMTALMAMLNSCASGVTVVNIDNGFGAAYSASMINHLGGTDD